VSKANHLRPELVFGYEHHLLTGEELCEVHAHIAECPDCRQMLARPIDLNRMVDETRAALAAPPRPFWAFPRYAAAAAILLAAGATAWFARHHSIGSSPRGPDASEVASLPDGTPPTPAVQEALRTGRVALPVFLSTLAPKHQVLMGEAGASRPQVLSPKATAVLGPGADFEWQSMDGSWTYQVRVFTLRGEPIAASPEIHELRWTCDRDLTPGSDYQWQLTAARGAERVTLPPPSETPPRFRVLDPASAERLRDLARRQPGAHLLLGVEFGRAGLLEDARRELTQAMRMDPARIQIRQLLQSLTPD
jgi:hypothetical protein